MVNKNVKKKSNVTYLKMGTEIILLLENPEVKNNRLPQKIIWEDFFPHVTANQLCNRHNFKNICRSNSCNMIVWALRFK